MGSGESNRTQLYPASGKAVSRQQTYRCAKPRPQKTQMEYSKKEIKGLNENPKTHIRHDNLISSCVLNERRIGKASVSSAGNELWLPRT